MRAYRRAMAVPEPPHGPLRLFLRTVAAAQHACTAGRRRTDLLPAAAVAVAIAGLASFVAISSTPSPTAAPQALPSRTGSAYEVEPVEAMPLAPANVPVA